MDSWLRHIGRGMADTGKIIHDSLDGFGQNAGNALDAWGKEMDKDLDPSHPISIAMTKTGEVAFFTGRETLRCLDGFGKQTEKTVSEAYVHVCQRLSQVDWDNLSHTVREWAENSGKEVGIAVSVTAENIFRIAVSSVPEIVQWVAEHPGQTTFFIISGVVFFAPFLITVPVLRSLGFTASGVAAGNYHSIHS